MFKLSSEASLDGSITVENKFIVEYLPYADGDYVKVYLYGLSLAGRKSDSDDTVDRLCRRLDLDRATVDAAIDYWCEAGLMSRLGDDITYLSLRTARAKIKKYDVDLYREFNRQAQLYISARQIAPNEFNEYYALMEKLKIEWQAMTLVVKYCVDLKGDNVSSSYILAVARGLAQDGYRTYDEVESRLEEYGVYYNELKQLLSVLGGKKPDHEAFELYKKWLKTYKFSRDTILHAASYVKKGGIAVLDAKLTSYTELGLTTPTAIDSYEADRAEMYKFARAVNKELGVYYENSDPEINSFLRPWLDLGFEKKAIIALAKHCFMLGLKTLPDLDAVVRTYLAENILTAKGVEEKLNKEKRHDSAIEDIMKTIGLSGAVKAAYRAFYQNWSGVWGFSDEVISYAATLSVGKTFAYINGVLAAWKNCGVKSVDEAKAAGAKTEANNSDGGNVTERISADTLNSLFTQISGDDNE
ncbi:MAG: DnaD domain protein [Clostridiales bacterium]|nr:DnaD domain protein [Clostridiales bacterium]